MSLISKAKRLALLVAALALAPLSNAGAAPYTATFKGEVTYFFSYNSGGQVPGNVGKQFSGWYTFDLANAEESAVVDDGVNPANAYGRSRGGCFRVIDGVCVSDDGPIVPVITVYHVDTHFGEFEALPTALDYRDNSTVNQLRVYPNATYPTGHDEYRVERLQQRQDFTSVPGAASLYVETFVERLFLIALTANNNNLFGTVGVWDEKLDLDAAQPGSEQFTFGNVGYNNLCLQPLVSCSSTSYLPDAFYFTGSLKSLKVREGKVPEPATLALLTLALGMFALRRGEEKAEAFSHTFAWSSV